jgi:c-di-GMP-binding flagellar brake protein YcgR
LIPQLLDPTQIIDAKRLCEKCVKIFVEKRKDVRIKRPLRVVITKRDQEESFHGTILDVSSGGALVKLENLPNFHMDEILRLKIYSYNGVSDKSDTDAISVDGAVKRLAENKNEIAIVFVKESSLEKLVNI